MAAELAEPGLTVPIPIGATTPARGDSAERVVVIEVSGVTRGHRRDAATERLEEVGVVVTTARTARAKGALTRLDQPLRMVPLLAEWLDDLEPGRSKPTRPRRGGSPNPPFALGLEEEGGGTPMSGGCSSCSQTTPSARCHSLPSSDAGTADAIRRPLELWPVSYQMYPVRPDGRPPRTRVSKGSRTMVDRDA